MIENLLAPENGLFLVALCLFLLIFVVQAISVLVGLEPFSFLDNLLPDLGVDLDVPDAHPAGFMDSVMSMLRLGRVPFIFTFILFLFLFSLIGLYGQLALVKFGLPRLHWALASTAAFVVTLPLLRIGNSIMERVLPKDETYSISSDDFIGRIATITIGTATADTPAEAKVTGPDRKTHYIRVIADSQGASFAQGEQVLVVRKESEGIFTVIENPLP